MKRSKLNFIFDAAAFAGFIFLTTTGVLMRYVLPPGSKRFKTIWGLDRHEWGDIHFWISVFFLGLLAMHLLLHWRWIINLITGKPREGSGFRAGLGIVGVIALLALSTAPLLSPIETTLESRSGRDLSSVRHGNVQVWGSMTLLEAEKTTDVPARYIIEKLKLPHDTEKEECLGDLRKTYGFTMDDVRRVILGYKEKH
ncbi:MAG: DUF4405 domain-containing protein [Candidatus Scalindua rubra]|uniref:Flavinylation-associated cytochrome domain-containing protein n=1 Tax=Candidatus Scalindua brodae TaxID=237368 RepID=A0A0B0EF83_9BACT|nr:MAG: hypothetical protein SCABRO_02468 [Candidatus Scalindua brodae]MBZ0108589.1 DUF4405 domain-containing protein [Candidatus Scalindua rubra]TWU38157.1 hypothetical protein S225a_02040 [Candidatus Brocadiaceae bacterium S225]